MPRSTTDSKRPRRAVGRAVGRRAASGRLRSRRASCWQPRRPRREKSVQHARRPHDRGTRTRWKVERLASGVCWTWSGVARGGPCDVHSPTSSRLTKSTRTLVMMNGQSRSEPDIRSVCPVASTLTIGSLGVRENSDLNSLHSKTTLSLPEISITANAFTGQDQRHARNIAPTRRLRRWLGCIGTRAQCSEA